MEKQKSKYPKPSLACDIIVSDINQNILLIKRKNEPFKDCWALPGGFFEPESDNSLVEAALRELREETSIGMREKDLTFLFYQDAKERDPRDRVISFVFSTKFVTEAQKFHVRAGDDAKEAMWFPSTQLPTMAFDHLNSIMRALQK